MPDRAGRVVPSRAGTDIDTDTGTETDTHIEVSIERVLLGHRPVEVVYDCR